MTRSLVKANTEMKINSDDSRAEQLAQIAANGDDDNAECAAADLFREFSPSP